MDIVVVPMNLHLSNTGWMDPITDGVTCGMFLYGPRVYSFSNMPAEGWMCAGDMFF